MEITVSDWEFLAVYCHLLKIICYKPFNSERRGKDIYSHYIDRKRRSSCPEVFCEKGVLKNFPIFKWKHLCWSLFLIKLQTLGFATSLNRDLTQLFSCESSYFEEHVRTTAWSFRLNERSFSFKMPLRHWSVPYSNIH